MLVDAATERDLLALGRADGLRQQDLGQVGLDREHLAARRRAADVHHEDLLLLQLLDLGLLRALARLHAQQAPQQVEADLDLDEHVRQPALEAEHLADEPVRARQRRVDVRPHADQPAGHGVLEPVPLREQRRDAAVDRRRRDRARRVLRDDAGAHLDLVLEAQHALEDGPARDAALEVRDVLAGLVHVEAPDDDEARRAREVAHGRGDGVGHVLADGVDVVLEHGRDGDDGRVAGDGARDELADLLVLRARLVRLHEVHLVLEDQDVLEAHDLDRREVLRRLRLRARLVARDEEQRRVHDGRAVEHRRHQDVVARAVHEAHVPRERPARAVAVLERVGRRRAAAAEVAGPGPLRDALVDLRVRIAQLDRDVALQLVLEAHRLHAADRLDDGALAVRDVADRPDVHGGLARDHLGRVRRERRGVQRAPVLHREAVVRRRHRGRHHAYCVPARHRWRRSARMRAAATGVPRSVLRLRPGF